VPDPSRKQMNLENKRRRSPAGLVLTLERKRGKTKKNMDGRKLSWTRHEEVRKLRWKKTGNGRKQDGVTEGNTFRKNTGNSWT